MEGAEVKIMDDNMKARMLIPEKQYSGNCFSGAVYITSVNDSLLTVQYPQREFMFSLYDTKNDSLVCSFLHKGRGVGEANNTGGARYVDKGMIDISSTESLFTYKITDLAMGMTNPSNIIDYRTMPLKGQFDAYRMNDSYIFRVMNDSDIMSYKVCSTSVDRIDANYSVFGSDQSFVDSHSTDLQHSFCLKPDGTKAVLAMTYYDVINILDLEEGHHFSIAYDKHSYLSKARLIGYSSNGIVNRVAVACEDFFITMTNIGKGSTKQCIFRKFSWDGELIDLFCTQEHLFSISVSPDGGTLFGITEQETVYSYKL